MMLRPNEHTWYASLIGAQTFVRVDVQGPMRIAEIRQLEKVLAMVRGWFEEDEKALAEACVAWAAGENGPINAPGGAS